jgi:hypothetical protein
VIYTLNARRGSTFILNGTADTVVDIPHHEQDFFDALRQRVIALNGGEKDVFETMFDVGASHRPGWIEKAPTEWLGSQLHFPNWPQGDIAKLPVISIREWAAKVGYPLGHSSGREDRDAGIKAIAADVPLMTDDETSVMSLEKWEQVKGEFVYASWVRDALADAAKHGATSQGSGE